MRLGSMELMQALGLGYPGISIFYLSILVLFHHSILTEDILRFYFYYFIIIRREWERSRWLHWPLTRVQRRRIFLYYQYFSININISISLRISISISCYPSGLSCQLVTIRNPQSAIPIRNSHNRLQRASHGHTHTPSQTLTPSLASHSPSTITVFLPTKRSLPREVDKSTNRHRYRTFTF